MKKIWKNDSDRRLEVSKRFKQMKSRTGKRLFFAMAVSVVGVMMMLGSPSSVSAEGDINANEQGLISAVSQSFSYNGGTYVVKQSYIDQGVAKLSHEKVNLSASEASGYISQFHGSYQELVEEGYCDVISAPPAPDSVNAVTPEPTHSKRETKENKAILKLLLGEASGDLGKAGTGDKTEKTTITAKDSETKENTANIVPTPTVAPASDAGKEWFKEEDLGTALNFKDTDRKQAKDQQVKINLGGGSYTISRTTQEKSDEPKGKSGQIQENMIDRLLHLSTWRIIYFTVLGLTLIFLGLAFYYIKKHKHHKDKKRLLRRVIAIGMGSCFGLWTLLLLVVVGCYFGIYNKAVIQRQLMESNYFLGVTQMVREIALEELQQKGYNPEVASEVFDLSSVYIEEKQYIAGLLQGKKDAKITDKHIKESLNTELVDEQGKPDQETIDNMKKIYTETLQFQIGTVIRQSRERFMPWFYLVLASSLIFMLALFIMLYGIYDYLHKSVRVISIALCTSSLIVMAGACAMRRFTGVVKVSPVYCQQFLQKYIGWDINVLIYMGLIGLLASVGLFIWKRYLHMIYVE